jgi:hypothetical protein
MALAIRLTLIVSMAETAPLIGIIFDVAGWTPHRELGVRVSMTAFQVDYSFWLDLLAVEIAGLLLSFQDDHPNRTVNMTIGLKLTNGTIGEPICHPGTLKSWPPLR